MFDWEFRDPLFLLLLVPALLIYWLAAANQSSLTYSSLSIVSSAPKSLRQRLSRLPAVLLSLAFASMIVALARPRTPQHQSRVSRDGIAIMMVVDLSSSMDARDLVEDDLTVNRLDVVKEVFSQFVLGADNRGSKGRPDDLIGLVTFAGYADGICPLTLDHLNLVNIVNELQIVQQQSEDGTAIGDGLGLAVERLRQSKAKSRVAILLTDGVSNAGVIAPVKAAELAAEFDIKVYCIGAGTNGIAKVPYEDPFGRLRIGRMQVEIDEDTLEQIASATGGKYFRAENREALADIYASIDEMERTEITEVRYLRYNEHFSVFLVTALGLLAFASLISATVFRKLP